jgi:hypothetical protein
LVQARVVVVIELDVGGELGVGRRDLPVVEQLGLAVSIGGVDGAILAGRRTGGRADASGPAGSRREQ